MAYRGRKAGDRPATNPAGNMTRLARSGKNPGERRREQLAQQLGLGLNGKPLGPPSPGMVAVSEHHRAAMRGESSDVLENPAWEDNPVVAEYKLRYEMRKARLQAEARALREGKDLTATAQQVEEVIRLVRTGMTSVEACDALGLNYFSFSTALDRSAGAAERMKKARIEYAHQRVADIYKRIETEPDPQRARLYADTVKWEVSKVLPAYYGEKVDVQAGPGIVFNIGIGAIQPPAIDVEPLSKAVEHRHDGEDLGQSGDSEGGTAD